MNFWGYSVEELLAQRDPESLRSLLPVFAPLYHLYFRVQTEGWENIPDQGSFLLIGSHNGGLASPDLSMFLYDWLRRFGADRPVYGLMQREAFSSRQTLTSVTRMGAVPAVPSIAIAALRRGAPVLIYPGGVDDLFRPYSKRHQIEFAGRKGFVKLAIRENVPIIPLVSVGAHETLIVLTDCKELMTFLGEVGIVDGTSPLNRVFPIYLGLPWGLGVGFAPNLPFPTQIYTRVCPPIYFPRSGREALRDRTYVEACYQEVYHKMQGCLDDLVAKQVD